ncbi:hypothetical protein D3C71_1566280 [compost metagenome]
MLADQTEAFLIFCRGRILHPEQAVLFNAFTEAGGFDRGQPVVHVVQQVFVETETVTYCFKQLGGEIEVFFR